MCVHVYACDAAVKKSLNTHGAEALGEYVGGVGSPAWQAVGDDGEAWMSFSPLPLKITAFTG